MLKAKYNSELLSAVVSKQVVMVVAAFLLLSNLMLSWFVLTADTREKTIIVPTGFSKPFSVRGDVIDPVYIEQMTRYLAQLRWTYTEMTAEANFKEILKFVDPQQFAVLDAKFSEEAKDIKRKQISSAFTPDAFRIYPNEGRAVIRGTHIGYIGTQIVSNSLRYLEIQYRYSGDRFDVVGMKELVGVSFDELSAYDNASKNALNENAL